MTAVTEHGIVLVNESNAGPERLFSRVTKETKGRRSQLLCSTVEGIIRVQDLGAPVSEVDLDHAWTYGSM